MVTGQLSSLLLQVAFFLILVRVLDTYQYGLFIGVTAFVAILAQFATLGQGTILIRRLAQADLPFDTGSREIGQRSPELIELASQAFQARQQFRAASHINLLPNFAKLAAVLFGAFHLAFTKQKIDALHWSFWYAAASLLACTLALYLVRQKLGTARHSRFAREDLWEGLSYAVSGASFYVYNDIDKTFLAAGGFVTEAGFYGAAYRFIEVMTAPLRALNTAALPRFFAAAVHGTAAVRSFLYRVLAPSLLYSFLAGWAVFFLHNKVTFLLGKEFGAAGQVLRYLCFIPLLRCIHYAAGNGLASLGAQWIRSSIQIAAAVFNISINLYLIPRFSWHGAAWSSVATEGLLALAMTLAMANHALRLSRRTPQPASAEPVLAGQILPELQPEAGLE